MRGFLLLGLVAMSMAAFGQSAVPAAKQAEHHAGVNERGDHAMGFSHEKSTHHFGLTADGGFIEVNANEAADTQTREQIRMHLTHIAGRFAEGDFDLPMLIHGTTPPGVPEMQVRKAAIRYTFSETVNGGRVRIRSADADAVSAIHAFLAFQIKDHGTGDSTAVTPAN